MSSFVSFCLSQSPSEFPDLSELCLDLKEIFNKASVICLPPNRPFYCATELLPGAVKPKMLPVLPLWPRERIQQALSAGIICPFSSFGNAGLLFTETKDKTLCVLIEYCGLNDIMARKHCSLQRLLRHELFVIVEKCEFHLSTVSLPGLVKMDPEKVTPAPNWPVPTGRKQLQCFLGFANFYRQIIRDSSQVSAPFHSPFSRQAKPDSLSDSDCPPWLSCRSQTTRSSSLSG